MMAEIDEEYEISDAITSLGRLLRYSMKWTSKNVLLKDEMDYIRDYMALINLRYDFTVTLSTNIPEELMKQEIPKMSLQPVVENAILHGIEPLGVDSTIYIKAWMEEEDCIIEISDAGQGMTDAELKILTDRLQSKVEKAEGKGGIGLKMCMTGSDWNSDRNMDCRYLPERTVIPRSGSNCRGNRIHRRNENLKSLLIVEDEK